MIEQDFPAKFYLWVVNGEIHAGPIPDDNVQCAEYTLNNLGISKVIVTLEEPK